MKASIGIYAFDGGPWNMFSLIAESFRGQGYHVIFPAKATPFSLLTEDELENFKGVDVLLVGLASFRTENELGLISHLWEHSRKGKTLPVVVVEDVPGTACRPKAEGFFVGRPAMALVGMPQWKEQALDFGYGRAEYLGPPTHWEPSFEAMVGESVRPRFRKVHDGEDKPLVGEDVVFFFSGIKGPSIVNDVLARLRKAGENITGAHFVLGFKAHPGEKPRCEAYIDASAYETDMHKYNAAMEERQRILSGATMLDFGSASLQEIIRAVDLTIFTGGATDSLIAAYARRANAYYQDAATVAQHNKQMGRYSGGGLAADLGGSYLIGPDDFEEGVRFLLSPEGRDTLRKTQEKNFPLPDDWDTAPKIVRFLEERL